MTTEITRTPEMIAGEINAIKDQVRSTAMMASVEIGKRLQEAKAMVPAGEWGAWLQNNVDYSQRTAQNLMALAAEYAAGRAQTLEKLPYTKAVMLLSVTEAEREEFVKNNDVESMSTRELKSALDALRRQNDDMQVTIDQLLHEKEDDSADGLRREVEQLQQELEKTRAAVDMAKEVNNAHLEEKRELRKKLRDAEADLKKSAAEAETEKRAMERALSEAQQPIIQQVTPPDVEQELRDLRARLQRSQEEQAVRAGYEILKSSYERLNRQLLDLAARDPELAAQFRAAFARALRLMADGLEEKEASA